MPRGKSNGPDSDRIISQEVIRRARGKCQMCGRTTARHGIALIAEKCPWGRGMQEHPCGLWAICLECSLGLCAYLRSLNVRPETLRKITSYNSVHLRIGQLLRTFGPRRPAPSSLISSVAGQASWRSRLRELRQPPFSCKIAATRWSEPKGRVKSAFTLIRQGNLAKILDAKLPFAKRSKRVKSQGSTREL
jgi:hypothetical protein